MAVALESSVLSLDTLGGGSGNMNVSKPTGLASGDIWLIITSADNNGTDGNPTVPSGWVDITGNQRSGSGFPNARAFYKVATGSEGATQAVAFGSGTYDIHAHSIRISGCDTSAPVGNWLKAASANAPDITIQNNGSLAILYVTKYQGTTPTQPTGTTLLQRSTDGGFVTTGSAYELRDAGAYAPTSWTGTGTTNITSITIEFKPAAGGGSTVSGDGSATGTGAATGTGQSQHRATGSTAGASTVTGGGGALSRATGSIDGVGSASATGQSLFVVTGTSTGTGTASGASSSASTAAGAGSSGGTGAATAVGRSTAISGASSTGSSTVTGTGKALAVVLGSTSGTSTASGTTKALFTADGLSSGFGQASAVPEGVEAATATPYPSKRRRRHG